MISKNIFWTNDNLYILHGLNSESVDMIYLDPPFNSKRMYSAPVGSQATGTSFKDMWTWQDVNEHYLESLAERYPYLLGFIKYSVLGFHGKAMAAYLTYMAQRLVEMRRVLKSTGSIYLHCDPTASHYLKLLMDRIFGKDMFRNEIVWSYQGTGQPKKFFKKKHDVILFYCKTKESFFSEEGSSEIISDFSKSKYTKEDEKGKYKEIKHPNGSIHRQYVREYQRMRDVWEVPIINAMAKERTGYPTQKPLKLLERIIRASSNEGDMVLDPFCGCATTCVACQQLDRKWMGIDVAEKSAQLVIDRLSDDAGLFKDFVHRKDIPKRTDVQAMEGASSSKEKLFIQQEGMCNGCKLKFPKNNFEIDHIVPRAKGGGDYYENYQLLCGHCNRVKGDRPMEYVWMKVAEQDKLMRKQVSF